jgi:hypothetical protein
MARNLTAYQGGLPEEASPFLVDRDTKFKLLRA